MHDGLRVATLDTTPSIRRQAIKDSLTEVPTCPIVFLRQATQPTVAPDLPCYGSQFGLDAFGEELEQLLGVLVFSRREQGVVLAGVMIGEGTDDVKGAEGTRVRRRVIEGCGSKEARGSVADT